MGLKERGAVNVTKREFYPIWDLTKRRQMIELKRAGVQLPVDYRLFGRSFDGIYQRFCAPIKRYFPRDYERIKLFFPLVEADVKRWEFMNARRSA